MRKYVNLLICIVLIQTSLLGFFFTSAGSVNKPYTIWVVHNGNPQNAHNALPFNWIRYLSGITPQFKLSSTLSASIDDYENVDLIFYEGLGGYTLTGSQISTLKQYVQNGGNLFISSRVDVLVKVWYGNGGVWRATPYGFKFPPNSVLNLTTIFGNYSVSPGIFPVFKQWGFFDSSILPSTIIPVVVNNTAKEEPLVYAGTEGAGKVVFLPGDWLWCYSIGYPDFFSPIMLHLLEYLLPEYLKNSPKLVRADKQYVAFRIDDVIPPSMYKIKPMNDVFASYGVTHVTYGVIPNYKASQELLEDLSRMPGCEVGMHGDISGHTDTSNYDYTTAYARFEAGKKAIEGNYSVTPKLYLSPYNIIANLPVQQALRDLNLTWSSNILYYFNFTFGYMPSGVIDESAMPSWDQSSERGFWYNLIWFEQVRLLDRMPYITLLHPSVETRYLAKFLHYLQEYRDVEFVTMSEALAKSFRTVPAANIFKSNENSALFVERFKWTLNPYSAHVELTFNKTGCSYIQFNNTIISATINGTSWNEFEGRILKLPILEKGKLYEIDVVFGIPPPEAPIANFEYSPLSPQIGQAVTFNASSSYDPDGFIVSYYWDFGDGTNGTGISVFHTYFVNGTFTVTLTVVDNDGLQDIFQTNLVVTPPPPPSLEVSFVSQVAVPGYPMFHQLNLTITNHGTPAVFTVSNVTFHGDLAGLASCVSVLPKQKSIENSGFILLLVRVDIPETAELGETIEIPCTVTVETVFYIQEVEAAVNFMVASELPS